MIKLYTVYNDILINLLEKFFEMKKSDCKETIAVYRRFLMRQESIQRFLQLAEVRLGEGEVKRSFISVLVCFRRWAWTRKPT